MDQQYNYSPRDFVTVSARADTIESLAWQESEILNMGPETERATVTILRYLNHDLYYVCAIALTFFYCVLCFTAAVCQLFF